MKRYEHAVIPETDYQAAYSVMDEEPDGAYVLFSDVQAERERVRAVLKTSLAFCRVLLDVMRRDPLELPHNDLAVHIAAIDAELARR